MDVDYEEISGKHHYKFVTRLLNKRFDKNIGKRLQFRIVII